MKLFYPKFAWDAIRKNRRSYIPYMLTTIFVVAMYHILRNISYMPYLSAVRGASEISLTASLGSNVIAIFSAIFLFYTGSFLMKQRKKEFGLYSVLGMERRHIARILVYETLILAVAGVGLGLALGALMDYLAYLLLMFLVGTPGSEGFQLSVRAFTDTLGIFALIFLAVYLNDLRQIHFSSVISLLKSGSEGEREPKSKWVLTVLGILLLGAGYMLAVTITNPIAALLLFFVAVVLVVLGTYCLFTSGSIVFLKLLRRNKKYYYKTRHFISVSGMLYRMKQNAVSLANICILSTMVLITVSSTISLYAGTEEIVDSRATHSVNLTFWGHDANDPKLQAATDSALELAQELSGAPVQADTFRYITYSGILKGDTLSRNNLGTTAPTLDEFTSSAVIAWMPVSDYNALTGSNATLSSGEALLYTEENYHYDTFTVENQTYSITKRIPEPPLSGQFIDSANAGYALVIPDQDFAGIATDEVLTATYCGFDFEDSALEETFSHQWSTTYGDKLDFSYSIATREVIKTGLMETYAGLFFLGIFLGLTFLVATILIIYYKQVSEGLQDARRYAIMRQVGLTEKELRSSIHSQVLTVFFLPLITAFVHTMFAFPMVKGCLAALEMTNTRLFLICVAICCGVFALMYLIVYALTSKVYYHIVNQKQ